MPPDDLLTDDQVADLLVKEAQDCSLKYSAMGLDAFKSTKRPASQPKPNTRFLNNIIRDTNSHNRALLAKESAESQAKLRDLEDAEEKKRREEERKLRKAKPGPSDTRKRMLGDIAAILGSSSKRRRTDTIERTDTSPSYNPDSEKPSAGGRHSHRRKSLLVNDDTNGKRENNQKNRTTGRSEERLLRHTRRRDENYGGESSSNPRGHKHRRSSRHDSLRPPTVAKYSKRRPSPSEDSSDSDPLEEIIGPTPARKTAVQRRGRGANAVTSGIDSRFAPDYDPKNDVTPDPEEEDWDRAAEAFRDRQKWTLQKADRLRSAGFTKEQIQKWEVGDQKDEADVRWTKAGGLREWDRGKVVNKDGTVTLAADAE